MSFPQKADFYAWATSPEYLEIAKYRDEGAQMTALLVPQIEG